MMIKKQVVDSHVTWCHQVYDDYYVVCEYIWERLCWEIGLGPWLHKHFND